MSNYYQFNPTEDTERIEERYKTARVALEEWHKGQEAALSGVMRVRTAEILADRDRDFQAHGLTKNGSQPVPRVSCARPCCA